MSRSSKQRIPMDIDEDPNIRMADYSTVTREPKRRGRPKVRFDTNTSRPVPTAPQPYQFDENVPLPQFLGDATQAEIDQNIADYVYKHGKSQNDYLREWLPRRVAQVQTLLEMEGRNNEGNRCEDCTAAEGQWRCRDCIGGQMLCGTCLWKRHRFQPFHRVRKWNGIFFREGALWEVGIQICLGHKGHPCPKYTAVRRAAAAEGLPPQSEDELFQEEPGDPEIPEEDHAGDGDGDDEGLEEDIPFTFEALKVPKVDLYQNPFISIIDVTGVHYLPIIRCDCDGAAEDDNLDYLRMGLYPASFTTVKTVFTEAVLRDFRLSNLECKTSAYQYYQRIRRLTSPAFPKAVLNRYRELRRLSRQYRNMKLWRIHGKIYDDIEDESSAAARATLGIQHDSAPTHPPPQRDYRGTLGLFCAACPQPGINLAPNWKDDPDRSLYIRSLVADGNFKADQLNPQNVDDDVHLTDGEAYMTRDGPYQAHLREAEKLSGRYKSNPTCHNHHANSDADKGVVGKRVRGVGAHACARHGCFSTSSVVDFTKGEKQMHMDWSLIQAIATGNMDEIVRLLHIYDVNCQFAVHLQRRLEDSSHMTIPEILEIVSAIGMFHVHGHRDDCLYRYATIYIPGVGWIDGEVMETLWAVLNLTSPSTRGATIAHRTEVLDDHMGDSNWKKIINTAAAISKRFIRAIRQEEESREYLEDVEENFDEKYRNGWRRDIEGAEVARDRDVKVMDIMKSKNPKPVSRKEIEIILANRELTERRHTGATAWVADGLELEEEQLELRCFVRKIGLRPTPTQKLELSKKRRRMQRLLDKFVSAAAGFLDGRALQHVGNNSTMIVDIDPLEDELADPQNPTISIADPERQKLPFPSSLGTEYLQDLPVDKLAQLQGFLQVEVELRKGQANDCLEAIRKDLIQLSWQYKNDVRVNRSQSTKTRAWEGVRILVRHWRMKRQLYIISRFAMIAAADENTINAQYPFLNLKDCVVSPVIVAPNTPGIQEKQLNWLWRGVGTLGGDLAKNHYALEFWRVNWLNARAIHNRWVEELKLCRKEMEWTVRFYIHMAEEWTRRGTIVGPMSEGHSAYAARKVHMWDELARVGRERFEKLIGGTLYVD